MPIDYTCPKCNYATGHKPDMRRHFNRTHPCPDENGLSLTDEIMQYVLNNRKYHPPNKNKKDTNIYIHNSNTINKFITNMDFTEKMGHFLNYKQKKSLCLEDGLESHFENRVNRLENDKYPNGYFLEESDFYKIIDNVTKIDRECVEELNIFYKKAVKRFELYSGTSWESFIEEEGATELVRLIKSYFLDTYEQYLIRHLHADDIKKINRYKLDEHLKIYYRFIVAFGLRPFIADLSDKDLLGHNLVENNEHYLAEKYMNVFGEEKNSVKKSEITATKRKVINIIKENTVHNVSELNAVIIDILKGDDLFCSQLLAEQ